MPDPLSPRHLPERRHVYAFRVGGWLWCLVVGYRRRDGADCWALSLTRTPRMVQDAPVPCVQDAPVPCVQDAPVPCDQEDP